MYFFYFRFESRDFICREKGLSCLSSGNAGAYFGKVVEWVDQNSTYATPEFGRRWRRGCIATVRFGSVFFRSLGGNVMLAFPGVFFFFSNGNTNYITMMDGMAHESH